MSRTRPTMKTFQEFRRYYVVYGATGFTIHGAYKKYVQAYEKYVKTNYPQEKNS